MYEQGYRGTPVRLLIDVTKAISGTLNVWIIDVMFIKKSTVITFSILCFCSAFLKLNCSVS